MQLKSLADGSQQICTWLPISGRKIVLVGLSDETNQLSAEAMESWFWKLASAVAKELHISAVSFK